MPYLRDDTGIVETPLEMPETQVLAFATQAVRRDVGDDVFIDLMKIKPGRYRVIVYAPL